MYIICIYIYCLDMNRKYYITNYEIITTGHWMTDQVGQVLKQADTTEPQYNVLKILSAANGKPVAVGDILNKMVQRNSNVTRIVDRLLAKGFVERKECPTNRRKMDIRLTEEGELHLKKLDKIVYQFHKPMMDNLTNDELDTLRLLIRKFKKR